MSDASILPASDGGTPLPPDFDEGGGDDRRRLMIVGGIAAVVLVLIVGYLLFHGGGPSNDNLGPVTRGTPPAALTSPTPAASPSASPTGGPGAGTKLPKRTHVVFARDPFKPLIVVPTTGVGIGSVNVNGSGGSGGGFTFPSGGAAGGAPAVSAADGPPLWIELIRTSGSAAVFDVGYAHGKKFRFDVTAPAPTSVQGTVFDGEFALLGIQNGEVTVQVGDATPFDLHPGVSHPV